MSGNRPWEDPEWAGGQDGSYDATARVVDPRGTDQERQVAALHRMVSMFEQADGAAGPAPVD